MRVAETLLKERQIKGNQNANRPRTESPNAAGGQIPRTSLGTPQRLRPQGGGNS
jgi:hypothetical protein